MHAPNKKYIFLGQAIFLNMLHYFLMNNINRKYDKKQQKDKNPIKKMFNNENTSSQN